LALGMGVLWLGSRLPLAWMQGVGRGLGFLAYHLLPSRRHIVLRNLELCFPEWSAEQRASMVRANFLATGMGLMEGGLAGGARAGVLRRLLALRGWSITMQHSSMGKAFWCSARILPPWRWVGGLEP